MKRYRKALAAIFAGAVVLVASIPLDADPRLVAAGQLITVLAVLLGPANQPPKTVAPTLFARRPLKDAEPPPRE